MAMKKDVMEDYFQDPYITKSVRNIFCEDGVLYSYGYHFPMVVVLSDGRFLFNGDTYSVTTNDHQSMARQRVPHDQRIIVPFTALLSIESLRSIGRGGYAYLVDKIKERLNIVDHCSDWFTTIRVRDKDTGEMVDKRIHHLGASVFNIKEEYYLSGLDETGKRDGTYHLTKLPGKVNSVEEAFEIIKPEQIIGLNESEYIRQGEWFFMPCPEAKVPKEVIKKSYALPNRGRDDADWRHVATHGAYVWGANYVKGTIRHPDHRMLTLPDKKIWYKAYEAWGGGPNGEVVSFSAGGNVD